MLKADYNRQQKLEQRDIVGLKKGLKLENSKSGLNFLHVHIKKTIICA
jgi:hypothetical protein